MSKKYFSKVVDRYFVQWISVITWDTWHSFDMERFYQFLKALKRYTRRQWTNRFHSHIMRAAKDYHPNLDEQYVTEMANFFFEEAETCFAYEDIPFLDLLVKKTNPYLVSLSLQRIQALDDEGNANILYTSEEVEDLLAQYFGKDWRNQRRQKSEQ